MLIFENDSLYGATADMKRTDGGFDKGLYGAGEFAYSIQTTSSVSAAQGTNGGTTKTGSCESYRYALFGAGTYNYSLL